jgi:hypothetical protein
MAITTQDYNELQRDSKGLLEVSTSDFYFSKVRPHIQQMLLKCTTDGELIRTLEKVVNAADSFCIKKDYESFMESFHTLEVAITDRNYFNGAMKRASESEKEMVRELIEKISDLHMLVKCEEPYKPEEKKIRDRLNYEPPRGRSPIGENKDFDSHNMKVLNEPSPKKRIPNV